MGDEIINKIQGHMACFIVEASRPSLETSESRVLQMQRQEGAQVLCLGPLVTQGGPPWQRNNIPVPGTKLQFSVTDYAFTDARYPK